MPEHFLWGYTLINRNIEDSGIGRRFALLGSYRGAAPIRKQLAHGKSQSGYANRPREKSGVSQLRRNAVPTNSAMTVVKKSDSQNDGSIFLRDASVMLVPLL